MGLDILTENGQKTVFEEKEAISIWTRNVSKNYTGIQYIETHKSKPADVDGFATYQGVIRQVVECKCRQLTLDQLEGFNYEWLVTHDKLVRAAAVSKALCVPLFGWLYLVPEKTLLVKKLTDENGEFLFQYKVKRTRTQATCNGGTAERENAYINMSDALVLK